ncbi:hypothetical protein Bhyg_04901 [Pseudolycoriella hygida]|uniref:Uncharacterized protein n=1 Tax=Pseudolycoriella hygida TaxID=35572 RepID=A0A9Q0NGH2_9DIPT|nr:hypothetical protein Bhyg_04901 [Pseudolycoriella hygida]
MRNFFRHFIQMTRVLDVLFVATAAIFALQGNVNGFCYLDKNDTRLRQDVRVDAFPVTYEGGCYYDCLIHEADLFMAHDFSIEKELKKKTNISPYVVQKMIRQINRCKGISKRSNQHPCDVAAYFVGCAATKLRNLGFPERYFADMLLDIYQELRHDVRELAWPLTYVGGCYYECQIREAELFDENDSKIERELKKRTDVPPYRLSKMVGQINSCKDEAQKRQKNKCDAAAFFVECAADRFIQLGFPNRFFGDMLLDIYHRATPVDNDQVATEHYRDLHLKKESLS